MNWRPEDWKNIQTALIQKAYFGYENIDRLHVKEYEVVKKRRKLSE